MSLAGPVVWLLPGRGVKPGETYEQAAAREALGEAGISGISLGPCVWTAEYTATWPDDAPMHVVLRYYLARVEAGRPVSFAGHEPAEAATTVGCRWFTLTEVIERESRKRSGRRGWAACSETSCACRRTAASPSRWP